MVLPPCFIFTKGETEVLRCELSVHIFSVSGCGARSPPRDGSRALQLWDLEPGSPDSSEGVPLPPRATPEAPWSARSPPAGSSWPAS